MMIPGKTEEIIGKFKISTFSKNNYLQLEGPYHIVVLSGEYLQGAPLEKLHPD